MSTLTQNNRTAVLRSIESGDEAKLGTELCQQQNEEVITAVTFDHRGQYVFLGTTKVCYQVTYFIKKQLHYFRAEF
jgi:hypothetical protein